MMEEIDTQQHLTELRRQKAGKSNRCERLDLKTLKKRRVSIHKELILGETA